MEVPGEAFVQWAIQALGHDRFLEMFRLALKGQASVRNLDDYLKAHGAYYHYKNAVQTNKIVSPKELAMCLHHLRIPIFVEIRHPPWNRLEPDSTVVAVLGERQVTIRAMGEEVAQRVFGARDAEALSYLSSLFHSTFHMHCSLEVQTLPYDLPLAEAQRELQRIRKRADVGVIVVLGSPLVNPLADPIAMAMTDGNRKLIPGRFRWSTSRYEPHLEQPGFLSETKKYREEEQGIHRHGKTYPRLGDDLIFRRLIKNTKQEKFPDCGILMVDCREKPYLILSAGHGGCGTLACVEALERQEEIAQLLEVGGGRAFSIITVERKKPLGSRPEVDDLFVDSWRFVP